MFPMMQGPQALPDQVAYPMFWRNLTRFLAVSTTTIALSLVIRHCEHHTHAMLVSRL
ncbi:unnamed protein product [Phytomonas sp. EM1]|nr:unnamed protein product [Phytomonas sp. EM1]|eukprot:CCW60931.1 unnamed protein product [Phytomonas sp. isolate EM1]